MSGRISGSLSKIRETFDWKWVLVGMLFIVGANVLAYLALGGVIDDLVQRQGRVLTGAALMVGVALSLYFVGGVIVGRMSDGRTVKEPAVAAVLSLVLIVVLQFFAGMINIVGLVVGAPFCFGVAYLGGLAGERWQRAVASRRRVDSH